jgi:Rrf2 family protein
VQISARADYALRTCVILATEATRAAELGEAARPLPAEVIALRADLPARFLETLIAKLRQEGIIHSQRGSSGGCTLARRADTISVYDVVVAVDGPFMLVRGLDPDVLDYADHAPGLRDAYLSVRSAMADQLSTITLTSLVAL